jgi:hypothetical protein
VDNTNNGPVVGFDRDVRHEEAPWAAGVAVAPNRWRCIRRGVYNHAALAEPTPCAATTASSWCSALLERCRTSLASALKLFLMALLLRLGQFQGESRAPFRFLVGDDDGCRLRQRRRQLAIAQRRFVGVEGDSPVFRR